MDLPMMEAMMMVPTTNLMTMEDVYKRQDLASNEVAQEEFPYRFYVSDLAEKFRSEEHTSELQSRQ